MKTKSIKKNIPPKSAKHFAAAIVQAQSDTLKSDRLIDRKELKRLVPVCYPTIWKWMRAGSFPRAVNVGGKICWRESEVMHWIASRPVQPIKPIDESVEAVQP